MDSSFSVAKVCGVSVFDILEQDAENVIFVINYIIEKGGQNDTTNKNATGSVTRTGGRGSYIDKNGVKHVKVDMSTASGGWY